VSSIVIRGTGAVSPAGWGVPALQQAIDGRLQVPIQELNRPGWSRPLRVRRVPDPAPRPAVFGHARLRRSSLISQYAVRAAQEALGENLPAAPNQHRGRRLGVILCVMSGCVNYSRRFFDEVLQDPTTASPLVFPETVFNAPSSHLAAVLGTTSPNYTLVGDPATFLLGLVLAAEWLEAELVDGCLVVGAEELDWLTADAFRLFTRQVVVSEGAGALYLTRGSAGPGPPPNETPGTVELDAVTEPHVFWTLREGVRAAAQVAAELGTSGRGLLLCDGLQKIRRLDRGEAEAWSGWKGRRLSLKPVLGEGLMAAASWQCVAGVEALRRGEHAAAVVHVSGCNSQVVGARFVQRTGPGPARGTAP